MSEHLTLRGVSKSYPVGGQRSLILRNIDLDIQPGEFVSILGPSGCGKSTLLRLMVGLDAEYEGAIELGGKPVKGTGLDRGIVFQDHRLLPWLTLEENIRLALINLSWTEQQIAQSIKDHIELVGLSGYEKSYPHQLSGGMAQRGAIARALVARPEVLLLDEPFGSLDAMTRRRLQDETLKIWHEEQVSMVLVTHDIEEAIYLSTRIVVLKGRPGEIATEIEVDLPWPRDRASYQFADLRRLVADALNEEAAV